jgi:hypothetical protein
MHKVSDRALMTPLLLKRFGAEALLTANDPRYWACLISSEGNFIEHQSGAEPMPEQRMFAADMVTALNKHLHHDGAWLIEFTDPVSLGSVRTDAMYQRFVIMWMDADGDVQFPIEDERPFNEVLIDGPDAMIEKCEAAWSAWKWQSKVLDLKPNQTRKAALLSTVSGAIH